MEWIIEDDCYGSSLQYKCVSKWCRMLTKLFYNSLVLLLVQSQNSRFQKYWAVDCLVCITSGCLTVQCLLQCSITRTVH